MSGHPWGEKFSLPPAETRQIALTEGNKRYWGAPCGQHGEKETTSERYILGDKCVECDNRVQYRPTRRGMVSRARIGGPHDCQSIDNLKIARDTLDSVREIWE